MPNSKLLLASVAIALVLVGVRSDASIDGGAAEPKASGSALRLELDGLRSMISTFESSIEDRIREIKTKEDNIARLNAVIQEKLSSIASLETEIESLQKKGAVNAKILAGKAGARVGELETEIVKLKSYLEVQSRKITALDSRESEAEKKLQELNLRLESVQDNIHEKLKKHELTKPHATKELAWFLASAVLAFPIFFLYRVLSVAFCKKARKPRKTVHSSHTHRRPKRRHADK